MKGIQSVLTSFKACNSLKINCHFLAASSKIWIPCQKRKQVHVTCSSNREVYFTLCAKKMSGKSQSDKESEEEIQRKEEKMKLNESIPISLKASENLGQMYSNIKDESNRHCLKSCERPVSQMSNSEENMTQVYSDTTECGGSIEMQDSEEKSYNGMSRDPLPAQNDFVSKTKGQQKRQRQTSSSEENSSHQHKSSSPGSYRTNKKWRKLQHGPLDMQRTSRRWQQVKQDPRGSLGMGVSLMSYNILSQDLLEMHPDLYSQCRRRDLVWSHRGAAILREIIHHNPDIICLQEVQADHWKHDIRPVLNSHGYYGLYKKRDGDKPDGCAILYKKSKFTHVKFVPVQFLQGGILDRDNVGIILLLRPSSSIYSGTTRAICVATTHLLFNPRRGDVKLAQLMMFLAEIDKVAAQGDQEEHVALKKELSDISLDDGKRRPSHRGNPKNFAQKKTQLSSIQSEEAKPLHAGFRSAPGASSSTESYTCEGPAVKDTSLHQRYCPIILCGDFNTEPFCDLYRFIVSGQLKYEGLVSRFICGQSEGRGRGSDIYLGQHLLPSHLGVTESCQYMSTLTDRHIATQRSKSKPSRWDQPSKLDGDHQEMKMKRKEIQKNEVQQDNPNCPQQAGCTKSRKQPEKKSFSGQKLHHEQAQCGATREIDCSDREKLRDGKHQNPAPKAEIKQEFLFNPPKINSGRAYHSMNFKSVYSHVSEASGRGRRVPEISSQHARCSCTVDYIFYTPCPAYSVKGVQEEIQLELLARYSLLTSEEIAHTGHLPNATLPSDHLCLIAKFFLH